MGPPKCGNALMWRIMKHLIGSDQNTIDDFRRKKSGGVSRSHEPLRKNVFQNAPPPVFVGLIRDPRDAYVSYAHFSGGNHRIHEFNGAWFGVNRIKLMQDPWSKCTNAFREHSVETFRYEDLILDPIPTVERLAKVMKVEDPDIEKILHKVRPETAVGHARHITPGQWREFFPKKKGLEEVLCAPLREAMNHWGYE